ncbi:uncharacterized protein [Aegilops tauschii subsp. strangulata]|uniref:uncharacterized protein isoform X2 n=1 Tax=Aegilops tauschii subsp. strangulata TaxID=200361 RepID=UPI001ABCC3F9|nr:uncharacterized protein LOC109786944 isoform X2 [Aegilops tauschii subsp. strangulata]
MAVADAVLPSPPTPPPPPARIVVVMLLLVRFGRILRVAAGALTYVCSSVACISSGAAAALLVAHRAWGTRSGPFLFLQALMYGGLKVCVVSVLASFALAVLMVCVQRVAYEIAVRTGSTSEYNKRSFFMPGGGTRRNGKHGHSAVEMKLRREGVRRIWQGATVPIPLMVVSDPNRYKFSEEKQPLQTCFFLLLVDPNHH